MSQQNNFTVTYVAKKSDSDKFDIELKEMISPQTNEKSNLFSPQTNTKSPLSGPSAKFRNSFKMDLEPRKFNPLRVISSQSVTPTSTSTSFGNFPRIDSFSIDNTTFLENTSKILPNLYIGTILSVGCVDILKHYGITHILTAAEELTIKKKVMESGVVYKKISLKDNCEEQIHLRFKDAYEFIDSCIEHGGKIIVHCFHGISRSVTLVIAYLMIKEAQQNTDKFLEKYSKQSLAQEKIDFVQSKREIAFPNYSFAQQLHDLEKTIMDKKLAEKKQIENDQENDDTHIVDDLHKINMSMNNNVIESEYYVRDTHGERISDLDAHPNEYLDQIKFCELSLMLEYADANFGSRTSSYSGMESRTNSGNMIYSN